MSLASLMLTAAVIGAAGAPHCVAMCAAPCTAVARRCAGAHGLRPALAGWHAGRLVAYTVAGAVVAAAAGALQGLAGASAWLRPVWSMLQVATFVLGAWLLIAGRLPAIALLAGSPILSLSSSRGAAPGLAVVQGPKRGRGAWRRACLIGLGWVALPCGLLYAALAVAALADGPLGGAAVMAAFALTSASGLALGPWLWSRQRSGPRGSDRLPARLAGAALLSSGAWTLWQGLSSAAGAWCLPG